MAALNILAVAALCVGVCYCQTGLDVDATTENVLSVTAGTTVEPEPTEFSMKLYHRQSTTSSIEIVWLTKVPKWVTIESYIITSTKVGSDSITTSPVLPGDTDEFAVEDLIKDSIFDVCVIASILNDTQNVEVTECMESFTIPYIRDDSVYVLAIVILVIATLILIGYLSWRCAVNNALKRAEAEEEEEEESDEGKLKPVEAKPILLSPVDNSPTRPKSSIEDEDIPFITPPWSEIEREERAKAAQNNVA